MWGRLVTWEGAEALRPLLVPIESLHEHPRNPWRGNIEQIGVSLGRFGQVRPVLAQPDGTIIAGNHTFKAARDRGWTHIAAVQHEFASADEARDYLLADNRLPELGGYDRHQLAALLDEIDAADGWGGTGYLPDDLEQLRRLEEADLEPAPVLAPVAQPAPASELREVVLLLDDEQHAAVGAHVRILRHEYGLDVTETILEATHREAVRLNQKASS